MTVLPPATAPYLKPLPAITAAGAPFWDALKRHEFLIPRCDNCGDYNWVPYPACRSCFSEEQSWTKVSGNATLFTFTVVHRGPGSFNDDVPYVIGLAELVEQPRPCLVLGNIVGIDLEQITIGMPLKVAYEDIPDEDVTLWRWVSAQ